MEGYDVDSSKFSLEYLHKVIEPVGLGDLWKVVVDDSSPGAREVLLMVVPSTTWNLHRNKPELCPTRNKEVVNLSGLAEQRVKAMCGKQ